jgi:hypothetical protein
MSMALDLLIFIGLFALAIGLVGCFIGATNNEKQKLRAAHESRRFARQPWDADRAGGRGNR